MLKTLERYGRRAVSRLFPGSPQGSGADPPLQPSRILVIRTDCRLGNLVLLEPLLRSLRERFPDASMEVLASDIYSELLCIQGYRVIEVDKKGQIRDPLRFFRLVRELRGKAFDVAIDASHPHSFSLSGAVSALLSGAQCRVGVDTGNISGWFTSAVPEAPLDWHESRALHSLGTVWDRWPAWSPPELLAANVRGRDAAGLHVGASGSKKYPPDMLEELVGILSRRILLEIYWGSEEERSLAERLGRAHPVEVVPPLSISGLLERMSGLRVFVTADNGPMHAASALSVPVVALFRVNNIDRFRPLSPGSRVLFDSAGPPPELAAERVFDLLGLY